MCGVDEVAELNVGTSSCTEVHCLHANQKEGNALKDARHTDMDSEQSPFDGAQAPECETGSSSSGERGRGLWNRLITGLSWWLSAYLLTETQAIRRYIEQKEAVVNHSGQTPIAKVSKYLVGKHANGTSF